MKILSIVGARPQFIKLAPLLKAIESHPDASRETQHIILHTGQHYDYLMNRVFFEELGISEPDYNLEVGPGPHGEQTGKMLKGTERVLEKERPDFAVVYGDTNSTLAGALATSKLDLPLAHVEAGLRSYNHMMPEEVNRVLTDHCSDVLFCPTENAAKNFKKEGFTNIAGEGKLIERQPTEFSSSAIPLVLNVGDIMYDSVLIGIEIAEKKSKILKKLGLEPRGYYLATIHRAENSDNKEKMKDILNAFEEIGQRKPVVFPIHPRTQKNLKAFDLDSPSSSQVHLIDPISYFDMLMLEKWAAMILTDSGGMQKEAYFSRVPCVTLREETEWVETLESGQHILTGSDKDKIVDAVDKLSSSERDSRLYPYFGDGHAAERILHVILSFIA